MNPDDNNDPKTINADDQNTLAGAGVDLSGGSSENIAESETGVPENSDSGLIDMDTPSDPAGVKDVGIKYVEEKPVVPTTDLSGLAEAKQKQQSSEELEAEFKSELHDFKGPLRPESDAVVMNKTVSLGTLLSRIQKKLMGKKASVKEELGSLKKMKDAIGKDIEEIKELESSEQKVRNEIVKIESIKKEVEEIESQMNEDLK